MEIDARACRVLIVEDHRLVSEALAHALSDDGGIEVVGLVSSVAEARGLLAKHRVEVALLDFHLPDGDGLMLARYVIAEYPNTRVIMMTARSDRELLVEALQAGCVGFISKDESLVHLPAAIHSAASGTTAISPGMAAKLTQPAQPRQRRDPDMLETRDREILQLMAAGCSSAEISQKLFMSPNTLRNHLSKINQKLGTHSKVEALAKAIRLGIVSTDSSDKQQH